MITPLEQFIEILEAKKSIANGATVSAASLLESCIREARDIVEENRIPDNVFTTVRLRSGKFFDYANPKAEDFEVEDVARGLATEYRYAGQTDEPYSVAQHAVHCSTQPGTLEEQYERLHHDDPEFIMKDMPKPLKNLLPDYRVIEEKVTAIVNAKFGIPYPLSESCHRVDKEIFDWEYAGLMLKQFSIDVWDVATAESVWLSRHHYLVEAIKKEKDELRQMEAGNS